MSDGDVGEVNVAEWCLGGTVELDDARKLGGNQLERIKLACTSDLGGEGRDEVQGVFCFVKKPFTRRVGFLLMQKTKKSTLRLCRGQREH